MSQVTLKEKQAQKIAKPIRASECPLVRIQDNGLLHEDIEVSIDETKLRRGKTETLMCILYDVIDGEEVLSKRNANDIETSDAEEADAESDTNSHMTSDTPDTADEANESINETDSLGSPILIDTQKGQVAIITTKVAIPDDDMIETVKIPLMKTFESLGGRTVRIATVPYRSKKPLVIALVILAILALIAGIILSNWGDPRARKGYYDGKTKEEIQADLDSQVEWYAMEISVANSMVISEGHTEVEARIENVVNNHCDQKVKMYPKGHPEDVLFESGAIRPGEYIQTIELAHPLPVGRHDIIVEFQGYDQNPAFISNEGQFLGHDTFGASCAAQVTIDVRPAGVTYETDEAEK